MLWRASWPPPRLPHRPPPGASRAGPSGAPAKSVAASPPQYSRPPGSGTLGGGAARSRRPPRWRLRCRRQTMPMPTSPGGSPRCSGRCGRQRHLGAPALLAYHTRHARSAGGVAAEPSGWSITSGSSVRCGAVEPLGVSGAAASSMSENAEQG